MNNNIVMECTENADNKENVLTKQQIKRIYMREYMRQYNIKKYGEKTKMTPEQKSESIKSSHKKYYIRNKDTILQNQKVKVKANKIKRLKKQLRELEGL
jgi:hypothetical protein